MVDWDIQIPDNKSSTKVYLDSTRLWSGGQGVDSVASPICVESTQIWEGRGHQVPGFSSEFMHRGTYPGPAVYQVVCYARNSSPRWLLRLGSVSASEGEMREFPQHSVSGEAWVRQAWNVSVKKDQHLRMEVSLLDPGKVCIRGLEIRKLL
jgi:hypothetical protein